MMVDSSGEKERSEGDATRASTESGGRALKKGPWTAAEDGILIEYVKKHGEGNWNAVQKHTGLARCGKSCRLRWANHLRPNLKKGSFSQEEERVIIELHAKLGNKWARMAAQLPGRTDNEIKNYWNTRMKRRQRAGLPLYPLEVQQEATAFHLRQHHHTSTASFSALLSPGSHRQKPDYNNNNNNPSVSLFNFSSAINNPQKNYCDGSSFYATPNNNNQFKFYTENNGNNGGGGFALPLSPVSPFAQIAQNQPLSPQALQLSYGSYVCNSGLNSMILGAPYHNAIPGLETELPSIQTPPNSTTPASSGTSGGEGMMAAGSSNANGYDLGRESVQANSGLLDALLLEAEALSRNEKHAKDESSSGAELDRGKQTVTVEHGSTEEEDANLYVESVLGSSGGEITAENQSDEFSSSHSSTRKRPRLDPLEEMESMDDDLMSLLNNFPSTMPVPEWYPSGGGDVDDLGNNTHNGPSLCESNGNPEVDEQQQNLGASPSAIASPALDWSLNSSCWNNMPSIC